MTLREQIGQLFMMGFTGTTVSKDLASFMKAYTPGGAIFFRRNLESVQQIVDLTNGLQKLSPASPLLIAIDQEGGACRGSRLNLPSSLPAPNWDSATPASWPIRPRQRSPRSCEPWASI